MALIWYCEELKGDNPELSKKAMCEKASNIFNVFRYRIKYLFSKLSFISVNTFLKYLDTYVGRLQSFVMALKRQNVFNV
jgi:hypothetical protein